MAVNLYMSRVVLEALGETDYGIYNVVGGFVTMFVLISGAMTTATQRFLSYEIGKGVQGCVKKMFSTAVVIHIFISIVVIVLAESLGLWFINTNLNYPSSRIVAVNWVYQFSVLTFVLNVMSVPYNAAIIAYEKMSTFAYVSVFEAVCKLVIAYFVVFSSVDKLIIYSFLLALLSLIIRVIYGIYCNKNFSDCRCDWSLDKEIRTKMFSFVSWNLIGSLANVLKEQGVNVLLNIFFGAAINAARGVAFQAMTAISGFVSNFQLAMNPQIVKTYAANEIEKMYMIVFRGSKFSYLLLFLISLPIFIECPYVMNLWLKIVPEYTIVFFRIVIVTALVNSLSGTLITTMHASGKVRDYQIVVGGVSLVTLPLAYVFLKYGYPPYFAMLAGLLVAILSLFARTFMLNKSMGFPIKSFYKSVVLRVFVVSLLSPIIPIYLYVSMPSNFLSVVVVVIASLVSSSLLSYFIALEKSERLLIQENIKKIINKSKI